MHRHQLERWRSEAALCARQLRRGEPDQRRGTAALERRWAAARRALPTAAAAAAQRGRGLHTPQDALSPERRAACLDMGRTLPARWPTAVRSQAQRNAVLRWLFEKGVVLRSPRDAGPTRRVWQGGATPTLRVPGTVGACAARPGAAARAQPRRTLGAAGPSDDARAAPLTPQGSRSPPRPSV